MDVEVPPVSAQGPLPLRALAALELRASRSWLGLASVALSLSASFYALCVVAVL